MDKYTRIIFRPHLKWAIKFKLGNYSNIGQFIYFSTILPYSTLLPVIYSLFIRLYILKL